MHLVAALQLLAQHFREFGEHGNDVRALHCTVVLHHLGKVIGVDCFTMGCTCIKLSVSATLTIALIDLEIHTELLYTEAAVLIGMVYNFLPFMILQINTALTKMDKSLLEAAQDLGANKFQTFWKVIFPLSLPGVVSGITLVFLPAVSSFFIPKLLGGGQFFLIGNVIENQFITVGEWNFGSAISMIMAMIMMLLMMLVRKLEERNKEEK